jgi:hypothetical protein
MVQAPTITLHVPLVDMSISRKRSGLFREPTLPRHYMGMVVLHPPLPWKRGIQSALRPLLT